MLSSVSRNLEHLLWVVISAHFDMQSLSPRPGPLDDGEPETDSGAGVPNSRPDGWS